MRRSARTLNSPNFSFQYDHYPLQHIPIRTHTHIENWESIGLEIHTNIQPVIKRDIKHEITCDIYLMHLYARAYVWIDKMNMNQ